MPNVTLNGVAYNANVYAGVSSPATAVRAPQTITRQQTKAGAVIEAANGYRHVVLRNTTPKQAWELSWERAPEGTRAQVRALFNLATTFTAVLPDGTFTVQCHPDSYEEEHDLTLRNGTRYYNLRIVLYEP
jgi:hypothetical protein